MTKPIEEILGLSPAMMRLAEETAAREGIPLSRFIAMAVAEKVAALRTEDYFRERAARADWQAVEALLDRTGRFPPREGDELPEGYDPSRS
jgi:hypothetical protein